MYVSLSKGVFIHLFIYFCGVYVFMYVCSHVCSCMWDLGVNTECISQSLFTLVFETESPLNLELNSSA